MLGHAHPTEVRFRNAAPWLLPGGPVPAPRQAGLYQEQRWRSPRDVETRFAERPNVLASRWTDRTSSFRREQAVAPRDRYVVSVALAPARLRFARGGHTLFEGRMPAGMLHVTGPGQPLAAEFHDPCDFVHLYIAAGCLRDREAVFPEGDRTLDDFMVRDSVVTELARTLTRGDDGGDPLYLESVGQTILVRLLALRRSSSPSRVAALPKWRLRRVQEHIEANIAEPITLAHLAGAAGLSRMHFAAQFRAATGCSPHEYLLHQRIERAKGMMLSPGTGAKLVEVALSVGFQAQSHFTTVFKRLTGETPARWQRENRG